MKKLFDFLKRFWASNGKGISRLFVFFATLYWFRYTLKLILESDIGIVGTILYIVWTAFVTIHFIIYRYYDENLK